MAIAADQTNPVLITAGLILARTGKTADAVKVADTLANRVEIDAQAYARLIQAEVSLAQRKPIDALNQVREGQKLADTWVGRVILARIYLERNEFATAAREIDTALRRSGEATAVALDDVPTFRYFPALHFYKGLAEAGVSSPDAGKNFQAFLAIKANGDETGGLVAEARKRQTP